METDRKASWARPVARPLTEVGSRADLRDVPVQNGGSGQEN